MSRAAVSVLVFGIYMVILGLIMLVFPNQLLSLFAYPTTTEVWIRILGFIVAVLVSAQVQCRPSLDPYRSRRRSYLPW